MKSIVIRTLHIAYKTHKFLPVRSVKREYSPEFNLNDEPAKGRPLYLKTHGIIEEPLYLQENVRLASYHRHFASYRHGSRDVGVVCVRVRSFEQASRSPFLEEGQGRPEI